MRSIERRDYPRELCLAGRRELGEGRDTGHHALVRNGSGSHECALQKICQGSCSWCLASAPKVQQIQFTRNPLPKETQESVILPASAPQKMCLKEGDLGPALREEGGT